MAVCWIIYAVRNFIGILFSTREFKLSLFRGLPDCAGTAINFRRGQLEAMSEDWDCFMPSEDEWTVLDVGVSAEVLSSIKAQSAISTKSLCECL